MVGKLMPSSCLCDVKITPNIPFFRNLNLQIEGGQQFISQAENRGESNMCIEKGYYIDDR